MKRYYYTDPLAAAWMKKHYGMELQFFSESQQELVRWACKWFYLYPHDGHPDKIYIHPDSLHLLEPQVGDIGSLNDFIYGAICIFDTYNKRLMWGWGDHQYEELDKGKIIQRNGVAFMSPESEEA